MEINVTFERKGGFAKIGARTLKLLSDVVRKTAFDLEKVAKAGAPVDTGALRASIHTVTDRQSGYAAAAAESKARRPEMTTFPEVRPRDPLEAVVAVAAEYGLYVEMGTTRMAARPYMAPAASAVKPEFMRHCAEALRRGARG